jgi:hypothetical protein
VEGQLNVVLNRSLLNVEYNLINVLKATVSTCSHHVIFIEDYTEIICSIFKRNVLSIQYKKRLRWSNLMGKVKNLSRVFTDFCVSALTRCRH